MICTVVTAIFFIVITENLETGYDIHFIFKWKILAAKQGKIYIFATSGL